MSHRGGGGGGYEGSTVASSRATSSGGMGIEEAANDSVYMQKLLRKLKQGFMCRGVNGIPQLQPAFKKIDTERERHADIWDFKNALSGQGLKLSDREKEVLFHYFDVEGVGEVDIDSFLAETRETFSSTHQQVDDIFRKVRSKMNNSQDYLPDLFKGIDINATTFIPSLAFYRSFRRYRETFGLLPSDVVFLCRFFEQNAGKGDGSQINLQSVLSFLHPPTTNQIMKLALLKLRDAIEDRDRTHSGSIGLARLLMRVGGPVQDRDRFKQGMKSFGCALRDSEIDLIFEALHENNLIQVESVIALAQQDPIPVTESDVQILLKKLYKELTTRHQYGIVEFRVACQKYDPDSTNLIDVYCLAESVRALLPAQWFPDLEVEILFNRYRSRVPEEDGLIDYRSLIQHVRGPPSQAKVDVISQIWSKLDPEGTGFIPHELLKVSLVNTDLVPQEVFTHLGGPEICEETFKDYWLDVGSSIANQDFNLILWNAFDFNAQRIKSYGSPTPTKSPAGRAVSQERGTVKAASPPMVSSAPVAVESPGQPRAGYSMSKSPEAEVLRTPPPAAVREPSRSQRRGDSVPNAAVQSTGRRFVLSQGFGGGRSTLNIFGGGDDDCDPPAKSAVRQRPPHPSQNNSPAPSVARSQVSDTRSVPRSITGSMRGSTAVGRNQLHTVRPF
eukprot:TRINITY_DN4462_c3_g1_i1.p1 TRINITY_DN4462_c3_g1~~TRINITY_DN4462_c3_g1_i1.p1  ORF type:complete len:672 (+),score=100.17 TRINITY_DN4462_c3_g1_i1:47-2062(+)